MTLSFLAATLAQLAAAVVVGWLTADLVIGRLGRERTAWAGLPERALLSVAGFVAACVVLMVCHLVTGGAVFGIAPVVPVAGVALVVWRARPTRLPHGIPWLPVIAFIAIVGAIFILPDVREGPGARTGDPPWHLGWTEQLLHGEPVPTGPAPELGRNAYPWGLHAVMATMTRLVPGTTPLEALEALHFLLVLAIPLGAACLARRVRRDAGWAAAIAASLVGGWGWALARGAAFVTSPGDARYGADLVVASPNSVYELFSPALPRELGLVLLAAFGVLLVWACSNEGRAARIATGVVAGIVGLVSVPMFVSALVWTGVAGLASRRGARLRTFVTVALAAVATFALWAGPVVADYVRYGGFVDITPQLGKEWPLVTSLGSWGLLLPLAVAGGFLAARARRPDARLVVLFAAGTIALLGVSLARGAFGWTLAGNATLLHQGRVWPPAHLLGAAFAGVAVTAAFAWAWARRRALAIAVCVAGLVVTATSPVLASVALTDVLRHHADGFVYGRTDLAPGSFVARAAEVLGPDDTVAVPDSALAFHLFELSGCRLATYDDPRLDGNDLRIRYADLARAWDERTATGGFPADYEVVPAPSLGDRRALAIGTFEGRAWALVATSS